MSDSATRGSSRREFLNNTGRMAAAATVLSTAVPTVHAGEDNTIRLALVGCGGRGSGAVGNALGVDNGPIKLVAMADVFDDRLSTSYGALKRRYSEQVDVPEERKFVGFDAYKKAMDCLRAGDVVILATPPAFRWVHFTYAIERGLNVFMEKPISVDGPGSRRMFELGEASVAKNLKVGVGLMCRHCDARRELFDRIQGGEIGDITELRAYRQAGPTAHEAAGPKPEGISELLYQVQKFHSFLWSGGGCYSDFLIHNIDESCWMKDAWPVKAEGSGGRHYRGDAIDQNFDSYFIEYTFADGTKLFLGGRTIPGCYQQFASHAHGTKGSAVISTAGHAPSKCRTYKGWAGNKDDLIWRYPPPERSPYDLEWEHLIEAIRSDKPHNEVQRGTEASLVTAMGRMAAHTGQLVTWDQILNGEHEFAPELDKMSYDSPAPLQLASNGKYPVPLPGLNQDREF